MELFERYIYAVTQQLPMKQRADIEQELRSLMEDMLDERVQGREATTEDIESVLQELGPPNEMAAVIGTKSVISSVRNCSLPIYLY